MSEENAWKEFSAEYAVLHAKALTADQRQQVVKDVFGSGWGINNAHQYRIDLQSYELSLRAVEEERDALKEELAEVSADRDSWRSVTRYD